MSNLLEHAEREFKIAGWLDENELLQNTMMENIRELLRVFSNQRHSGFSANYALNLFNQLARFQPVTPLTGDDDEWVETSFDQGLLQNKRASHVFKQNGEAFDVEGKIFQDPDGYCYTSCESRVPVTFPYTPKREIIYVKE